MRFQYPFYFIILLSTVGCNVKHSEKTADTLKASSHIADKEENKASDTLKPPAYTELAVDKENKSVECVQPFDTGVEIIAMTEEWAKEMGLIDHYRIDPGFEKWCVLFHDIPGSPPYTFQQKRISQPLSNRYYPCSGPSSEDILESKNYNIPTGLVVSTRGYLPGEKLIIRLSAKDAFREATFYPRPLLLKKKSGDLLAKADLLCADPGHTLYTLDIFGIEKQEKYKLTSRSGEEIISQDLQGPTTCGISPEIIGSQKGVGKIELQLEDGTFYTMELPWGYDLIEYKLGKK